jgi:hypothetical protein
LDIILNVAATRKTSIAGFREMGDQRCSWAEELEFGIGSSENVSSYRIRQLGVVYEGVEVLKKRS